MWRVSLTYPVLTLFLCGEFLLHIPCCIDFYASSFSYTSRTGFLFLFLSYLDSFPYISSAGFIFIWGVSPKQPMLASFFIWGVSLTHPMLTLFLCGEFVLHIPCYLHFYLGRFMWGVSLTHPVLPSFLSGKVYVGSFSYTSRVAFICIWEGLCGEFLLHIPCCLHFYLGRFMWGVSLTHPVLPSFLSGKFLLHIPCCLHFYLGSFSYTFRAGFFFFLFCLVLSLFFCVEFHLHIPCWLRFSFTLGVCLTHTVLFFCFVLFLNLGSFSYTSHAGFIFIVVVSLTHPVLALFVSGEFLLHIPCWLRFYLGSFSYTSLGSFSHTSHTGFTFLGEVSFTHPKQVFFFFFFLPICRVSLTHPVLALFFICGVSLTHPVLTLFLSGEFLLYIPCWLHFYAGSFSYTSHTGDIYICGVSLTYPVLASFLSGEFLLHL